MPQLNFSQTMAASALGVNPLSGWQYEFLPWPAQIILLIRAIDINQRATVYSGSETIMERSPVQAGGVAGTTPPEINTPPIAWHGAAGDRFQIVLHDTPARSATVVSGSVSQPPFS